MSEIDRKEFLGEFLQEFQFAKDEVKKWSPELQAEALKTGILAFPRIDEEANGVAVEADKRL